MEIVEIKKVSASNEPGLLYFDLIYKETNGDEVHASKYAYRSNDHYGLSPSLTEWIAANPDFPVQGYVPPPPKTPEELRSFMLPISRRQLRLALVRNGISLTAVEALIDGMPDGLAKTEAQIEWADATTFERLNPTLIMIGSALNLTEEQVDIMWVEAFSI